jgi:ammonium transporter Rh
MFMRFMLCPWQVWWGGASGIEIDLPLLIDAAFAAGSAMIAFGAVLGKATPTQMLWLTALMIPIYAVRMNPSLKLMHDVPSAVAAA